MSVAVRYEHHRGFPANVWLSSNEPGGRDMPYATLRLNGKEFVLVPKTEFSRLTAQDRADARKAQRALVQLQSGKLRTISHAALKRQFRI